MNNKINYLVERLRKIDSCTFSWLFACLQNEEAEMEEQESNKKRFVFVSPFERYKRVIPMIAEQEAEERERLRQEEENRSNELKKKEDETAESKNRVYEHFKRVSQMVTEESVSDLPKKPSQIPLSQMSGRKRKRDSNINKQDEVQDKKIKDDLSNPTPTLKTKTTQYVRQESDETFERLSEEQNVPESITKSRKQASSNETINPLR